MAGVFDITPCHDTRPTSYAVIGDTENYVDDGYNDTATCKPAKPRFVL